MFKSGGYFKGVSCPFYLRGGCRRVYCPFRHARETGACPTHWPRDIVLPESEEVRGGNETGPSEGNFPLDDIITASDWASSLSSGEGKFPSASAKAAYSTSKRKIPSLSTSPSLLVEHSQESTPLLRDSAKEVPSSTVRDIFGNGSEDETESWSCLEEVPGGGSKGKVGGSKGEVGGSEVDVGGSKAESSGTRSGTSDDDFEQFVCSEVASGELEAQRQAATEEHFTRVLTGLKGDGSEGGRVRGRGSSTDSALTTYSNQGVKITRRAHPNAGTVRDPAAMVPAVTKSRSIQSNFSAQLADPEAVFTSQKRLSHQKQQESQSDPSTVAERPRLKTTINAKIPTSLRQKFLDGFIDEYLKMANSAQAAYRQAMEEEAAIEHRSRSKMLYLNLAGNQLRALRDRAGGGRGAAPDGGRGTASGASTERTSTRPNHSQPSVQQSHTGVKRGARLAPPPGKARKLQVAGASLPLDVLMPASTQAAVGGVDKMATVGGVDKMATVSGVDKMAAVGAVDKMAAVGAVDKQVLSSSGEGGLLSAASNSAVGKTPDRSGKISVSANLRGKSTKPKTAPQGARPVNKEAGASVKSNKRLQEMFGSDSDDEGWEVHTSWDQAMTVSDSAASKGNRRTTTVKGSKAKAVSQVSGNKKEIRKGTTKPCPTSKTNWSVVPTSQPEELTEEVFYSILASYVLSEEELVRNSYPRSTGEEGEAFISQEVDPTLQPSPCGANAERHHCCRCGQPFLVYEKGRYQDVDECVYHYGKIRKYRDAAQGMVLQFSCCGEPRGAVGCQVAQMHVTAGWRQEKEMGFVETGPSEDSAQNTRVLALDCEMCYTTVGLELARVTVVDMHCNTVYDSLVLPSHPIVDYNTRFSGLTAHDFTNDINTSLTDVQAKLMTMVSMETILLGHSLDSDLRALKVVHSHIVDTALVFPHRLGPPYKRALKTLAAEHLGKIIQDSAEGGHDCAEDACSCMLLMLKKARSDHLQSLRRSEQSTPPATSSSSTAHAQLGNKE